MYICIYKYVCLSVCLCVYIECVCVRERERGREREREINTDMYVNIYSNIYPLGRQARLKARRWGGSSEGGKIVVLVYNYLSIYDIYTYTYTYMCVGVCVEIDT